MSYSNGVTVAGLKPASEGRPVLVDGATEAVASEGEYSTRIPAPMNLDIVAARPFRARRIFCEDRHGWVGSCEVPPSEMRGAAAAYGAPRDADVCIWAIEKGSLAVEQPGGSPARFGPGTLLLCAGKQPPIGRWDHARFSYVRLAADRLSLVLGHAAATGSRPMQRLENLGLAPFLMAQLNMLAAHGTSLAPADLDVVVAGILHAAEALLKVVLAPAAAEIPGQSGDRLQAVHRYIERNLHRHDLSVADIARGTSISRAQLYRLFAEQEVSVHGTLREQRLQKSMSYLKQPESRRLSIGAIAYACGFSDPAVFSKLFRQRFLQSPREIRSIARSVDPA